jgi:hypothetical protein
MMYLNMSAVLTYGPSPTAFTNTAAIEQSQHFSDESCATEKPLLGGFSIHDHGSSDRDTLAVDACRTTAGGPSSNASDADRG